MPDALAALPTTGFLDNTCGRVWPWYLAGERLFVPAAPVLLTDDPEAERDAVLAGIGYGQMPYYLAAPYLATERLVTVLDQFAPPPWDVFVFRPQRGPVPPRIRLVFDAIVFSLQAIANGIPPGTTERRDWNEPNRTWTFIQRSPAVFRMRTLLGVHRPSHAQQCGAVQLLRSVINRCTTHKSEM